MTMNSSVQRSPAMGGRVLRARRLAGCIALVAVAAAGASWVAYARTQLFVVGNAPDTFDRRGGHLTANVTGSTSRPFKYLCTSFRARVNGGPWRSVLRQPPRAPWPNFTVEMPASSLVAGRDNVLEIEARALGHPAQRESLRFAYAPEAPVLPRIVDWEATQLQSDDGLWEAFEAADGWRVRPRPGYEGYDKVLIVAGAFTGGRRVETDVVFRHERGVPGRVFGFGVVNLWGGRPDDDSAEARRGWSYALAWYLSSNVGVGNEFGLKNGDGARRHVGLYRDLDLRPGVRYRLVSESRPTLDGPVGARHVMRLKWWEDGEPEPDRWLELDDGVMGGLPGEEHAVALLAYFCQADFGSVTITPLPGPP